MSIGAQRVLDQFKALPPSEQRLVWQTLQHCLPSGLARPTTPDPIRSARGMLAGEGLNEALLASRAEDRRRG